MTRADTHLDGVLRCLGAAYYDSLHGSYPGRRDPCRRHGSGALERGWPASGTCRPAGGSWASHWRRCGRPRLVSQ